MTYWGYAVSEAVPAIWLLHLGVFVVWIPTALKLGLLNRDEALSSVLDHIPVWLLVAGIIFGPLIFASGFAAMAADPGEATYRDGQYLLMNRGEVLRVLSEEEFLLIRARADRLFSAVWVMFYGAAAVALHYIPLPPRRASR